MDLPRGEGVLEGFHHGALADHVGEGLGPVLSGEGFVGHGRRPSSQVPGFFVWRVRTSGSRARKVDGVQATCGTQAYCLPLLPSGPGGVHRARCTGLKPHTSDGSSTHPPAKYSAGVRGREGGNLEFGIRNRRDARRETPMGRRRFPFASAGEPAGRRCASRAPPDAGASTTMGGDGAPPMRDRASPTPCWGFKRGSMLPASVRSPALV